MQKSRELNSNMFSDSMLAAKSRVKYEIDVRILGNQLSRRVTNDPFISITVTHFTIALA
jgi:hypothetical protein